MAQLGSCSDSFVSVNDAVCMNIDVGDTTAGDPITVWTNDTDFEVNGTVMVENNGVTGVAPTVSLLVNGVAVTDFDLDPGEGRAVTINAIESISLAGAGGTGTARVKISFSINYKY